MTQYYQYLKFMERKDSSDVLAFDTTEATAETFAIRVIAFNSLKTELLQGPGDFFSNLKRYTEIFRYGDEDDQ